MAKITNQKGEEQYYFDMFRKDYQLPEGIITHDDKPDVILDGKKKIGIEITNFFLERGNLPGNEQAQREKRETVVSKAQQVYLADGGKKVELSFGFDKETPISGQDKKQLILANRIATVAKKIDRLNTGSIHKDIFEDIPELAFIYLNAKEYEEPKWRVVQGYSVPLMSMEKINKIVKDKEAKSKCYQPCDSYWLIVIVDFFDPAQDQETQINDFEKIDSTVFEKVIVYKTILGQVLEAK